MADDASYRPEQFRRIFTLEEANSLLPELIPMLAALQAEREAGKQVQQSLGALSPAMRGNGSGLRAAELEQQLQQLAFKIAAGVRQIAALGVEIKNLDHGLIDFPSLRDGRVVYLCWHLGEDRIAYWHEIDSGFAGRQPLS